MTADPNQEAPIDYYNLRGSYDLAYNKAMHRTNSSKANMVQSYYDDIEDYPKASEFMKLNPSSSRDMNSPTKTNDENISIHIENQQKNWSVQSMGGEAHRGILKKGI